MSDEDRMIKKLKEHRDTKKLIVEIGMLYGIDVVETKGNDSRGDFYYSEKDHEKLVNALDQYLGHHKYVKKGDVK